MLTTSGDDDSAELPSSRVELSDMAAGTDGLLINTSLSLTTLSYQVLST